MRFYIPDHVDDEEDGKPRVETFVESVLRDADIVEVTGLFFSFLILSF
jgi:hypothetical protein